MFDVIKRDWKGVLFQSAVTATAFIVLLIIASFTLPNQQEQLLKEISNATKAEVCVLTLPVTEKGRDPAAVEACLSAYGLGGGLYEGVPVP